MPDAKCLRRHRLEANRMNRAAGKLRGMRMWRSVAVFVAICSWAAMVQSAPAHEAGAGSGEDCALANRSSPRAVVRVIDGATLVLDDGSHVRLIGALPPTSLDAAPAARVRSEPDLGAHRRDTSATASATEGVHDVWQPAVAAREALARFIDGRSVTLATAGRQRDRYGRVLAHVFVNEADGSALWLQGAMLAAGHARAYGIPDTFSCMDALLAAEAPARTSGLGLWANPAYAIRPAALVWNLLRLRGTYQIVAGTVLTSQRVKSGWIYLNFGGNWRRDFSVSVAPGVSRAHPAWAALLLDLKGRQVRVRGWIDRRNGPTINIEHPSQIEFMDADVAARSPMRNTIQH